MGGFPALSVQPVQQPDILGTYGRLMQIKNMQQQSQLGNVDLQQKQMELSQTQAINDAYHSALTVDSNGAPTIDEDSLQKSLAANGHGAAIPGILENLAKYKQSQATLQESQQKIQTDSRDSLGLLGSTLQQAKYDPNLADLLIEERLQSPGVPPQEQQQLQGMRQAIQKNPAVIQQLADSWVAQSPKQQELGNAVKVAQIRANTPEAQRMNAWHLLNPTLPLSDYPAAAAPNNQPLSDSQVNQLNQGLTQRWQVLNPGKPLPLASTLASGATQGDFDRIDKLMQATEQAAATKAQQDTANKMRADQQKQSDESKSIQPVTGTDKNGRTVLVSQADAEKTGVTGIMKADSDLVNKAQAARHWIPLADKQTPIQRINPNDPNSPPSNPEDMGILQLVDDLDKRGKLGVIASRWNDFMAGTVGAGDPEVTALRTKMGLSTTLLMQAHVGSRGGSYMLEHFQDLANAKKMDASTLKAGVKSELDYVKDRAMLPATGASTSGGNRPSLSDIFNQ